MWPQLLKVVFSQRCPENIMTSLPAGAPGPPQSRPGRSFIPGASGAEAGSFDWSTFPEKYMKTSGRILTRMQKDLNLIAAKVKENLAWLSDRGRSGD